MEELITIATFNNTVEAHLLRSRLESEGIRCYLHDDIINTLIPAGPFGGVKLQVHLQDSIKAFDIFYDLQDNLGTTEI